MSHAVYLFLTKGLNIDNAVSIFEDWIEERGDSNNWFTILFGVNSKNELKLYEYKGEVNVSYIKRKHVEGIKKLEEEYIKATFLNNGVMFHDMWIYAWDITLYKIKSALSQYNIDFISIDKIVDMYIRKGNKYVRNYVLKRLVKEFSMYVGNLSKEIDNIDLEDYSPYSSESFVKFLYISSLTIVVENLFFSMNPPFGESGNPYTYRCFDLTNYSDDKGATILAVDIHT